MKNKDLIKLLGAFLGYFIISFYGPNIINFSGNILNMFIKDVLFIIFMFLLYWKDLKIEFEEFKKQKKTKNFFRIIGWVFLIYILTVASNVFAENLNVNTALDGNNAAIEVLFNQSKLYTFFKTIVYTALAEVILYKYTFRKAFKNNFVFVIIGALVYTFFNYFFIGFNNLNLYGALFVRFIPDVIYLIAYIKNNNNVFNSMIISALCNLVPFAILLLA
ncbi:MAG: hypothetical protein IJO33_05775 [Bacilli bacterium]|nr:hypothetical protein [Bacilli bacterium]